MCKPLSSECLLISPVFGLGSSSSSSMIIICCGGGDMSCRFAIMVLIVFMFPSTVASYVISCLSTALVTAVAIAFDNFPFLYLFCLAACVSISSISDLVFL